MSFFRNFSNDSFIHFLLKSLAFFTGGVSFARFFKHLTCSFGFLLSLEKIGINVNIASRNIDLGLSSNDVRLWDTSKRNTIYFVRSCYKDKTGILEIFHKNYSLSLVSPC